MSKQPFTLPQEAQEYFKTNVDSNPPSAVSDLFDEMFSLNRLVSYSHIPLKLVMYPRQDGVGICLTDQSEFERAENVCMVLKKSCFTYFDPHRTDFHQRSHTQFRNDGMLNEILKHTLHKTVEARLQQLGYHLAGR